MAEPTVHGGLAISSGKGIFFVVAHIIFKCILFLFLSRHISKTEYEKRKVVRMTCRNGSIYLLNTYYVLDTGLEHLSSQF